MIGVDAGQTCWAEKGVSKEPGCLACHDVGDWKVGPPLTSVAVKYRANWAASEQRITATLEDGLGHPKTDA